MGMAVLGIRAPTPATRAPAPAAPTPAPASAVRSSLTGLVDSIGVPAIVQTPRLDLVAANALGRFIGTLLSGLLYQWGGLLYALLGSAVMLLVCWLVTLALPLAREESPRAVP